MQFWDLCQVFLSSFSISTVSSTQKQTHMSQSEFRFNGCVCLCTYSAPVFYFFLVSKPRATGWVVAMEFWHHLINENRWVWEVNMGWSCWRVLSKKNESFSIEITSTSCWLTCVHTDTTKCPYHDRRICQLLLEYFITKRDLELFFQSKNWNNGNIL